MESIIKALSSPVAVVTGDPGGITSPESEYKCLTCAIFPGVILRLLYDKGENLIKPGRKIKSLSGIRRGRKQVRWQERRKPENKGGRKRESEVSGERNHQEGVWENRPHKESSGKTEAIDRKWRDFQRDKSFHNPISHQFQHESIPQRIRFGIKQ